MKRNLWIALVVFFVMTSCCTNGKDKQNACKTEEKCCKTTCSELPAITKAIDYYIEGGRMADSKISRKAFAEGATMSWMENGVLQCVPIQYLYDIVDNSKPGSVSYDMTSCNVQNDVAIVRIESQFGETRYTDMFTLVKTGEGWKIISKIYTVL